MKKIIVIIILILGFIGCKEDVETDSGTVERSSVTSTQQAPAEEVIPEESYRTFNFTSSGQNICGTTEVNDCGSLDAFISVTSVVVKKGEESGTLIITITGTHNFAAEVTSFTKTISLEEEVTSQHSFYFYLFEGYNDIGRVVLIDSIENATGQFYFSIKPQDTSMRLSYHNFYLTESASE